MAATLSPQALYSELGLTNGAVIVDARSAPEIEASPRMIPGASFGPLDRIDSWCADLPLTRRIAVYCSHGERESRAAADALVNRGYPAFLLEGGLATWIGERRATTRVRRELRVPGGSRWVTRARPKIDRVACPWLVRRFIDPDASFFYTAPHHVRTEAVALDAQPYDIDDVTFSHRGARCSFDAFLDEFDLHDPIIDQVATIVRAADTAELEQSREAPGLLAISLGLSATFPDDLVMLEQAMTLYDALYAWCKRARTETHSWPKQPARR